MVLKNRRLFTISIIFKFGPLAVAPYKAVDKSCRTKTSSAKWLLQSFVELLVKKFWKRRGEVFSENLLDFVFHRIWFKPLRLLNSSHSRFPCIEQEFLVFLCTYMLELHFIRFYFPFRSFSSSNSLQYTRLRKKLWTPVLIWWRGILVVETVQLWLIFSVVGRYWGSVSLRFVR